MTQLPAPETVDVTQRRLGRLYAADPRDLNYPMADRLRTLRGADAKRQTQAWRKAKTLDQGNTSECTKYGTCGALGAAPYMYKQNPLSLASKTLDGFTDQYTWSQAHDEFPGDESTGVYGSSGRAAMEFLRGTGAISAYHWARNVEEAKDLISKQGGGPLTCGSDWHASMDAPNAKGVIETLDGGVLGGHQWYTIWYAKKTGLWKCVNSWGEGWGLKGVFYLPDELFQFLIWQANGDCASMVEVRK